MKSRVIVPSDSVPRGRPLSEGKLVRKGIHLKSQDKARTTAGSIQLTALSNLMVVLLQSLCFIRVVVKVRIGTYNPLVKCP